MIPDWKGWYPRGKTFNDEKDDSNRVSKINEDALAMLGLWKLITGGVDV